MGAVLSESWNVCMGEGMCHHCLLPGSFFGNKGRFSYAMTLKDRTFLAVREQCPAQEDLGPPKCNVCWA